MSEISKLENQIVDLQNRVSFQEDTLQQLNTVIAAQDQTITELQQLVRRLADKINDVAWSMDQQRPNIEQKPPHY